MADWQDESANVIVAEAHGRGAPLTGALRQLVDKFGHIPAHAIGDIAQIYNQTKAEVKGVISFYDDFRDQPPGKRVVKLCQAEACQAVGSRALSAHAEEAFGISLGETAADGSVTLEAVYCLGLCACGPAMLVDDVPFARVTTSQVDEIAEKCGS